MSLLKRINTSSFLLGSLVLLALFQLIAGALFLKALNSDNKNFETAATLSTKYTAVTNAWFALNAAGLIITAS
ncbi:MAG: hypothetical protein XXXJIFNMEKO3_01337 [Candidatus Erwinia impunctatus]|nr:hypothetical protein XXXJIFNMEKO_01337 [Culicoides impunctatus]